MLASEYNIRADREAEEAAIACCLVNSEAPRRLLALVEPGDMVTAEAQLAYQVIAELVDAGTAVNLHSLVSRRVSPTWLEAIIRGNAALSLNVTLDYWAEFIRRQAKARQVVSKAAAAISAVIDGQHPDDVAFDLSAALRAAPTSRQVRTRSLGEVLNDSGYPEMLEWMADPKRLAGPSWGIDLLDTYLGGLGAGRLIAIGADTGIGKSVFVQHIARELTAAAIPVHVVSTEMGDLEVFFRMAFMEAGFDKLGVARRGHVRQEEREAMLEGLDQMATRPLYLTELAGMSVDALEAEVQRVKEQFGTRVVVLDLLNGLPVKGDNRAQGIAVNTSRLKQMAEAQRVCLLMTAHINRDAAKGVSELGLHSFKDSGAIEQDADQALILVPVDINGARMLREDVAATVNAGRPVRVSMRICKNRHGAEGTVSAMLHWGKGGRFVEEARAS